MLIGRAGELLDRRRVYGACRILLALETAFFVFVIAGTHGRSMWILDDLTPLRALADGLPDGAHLFQPRDSPGCTRPSPFGTTSLSAGR